MATMLPPDNTTFTTEGEKRFYHFISCVAKPDAEFICWYQPDLKGREPDFLVFSKSTGLVVFEVKDWALEQIREADAHHFTLEINGRTEKRPNPYRQAKEYIYALFEALRKDGRLASQAPPHQGKPIFPVDCGVVFANINKHQYVQQGLDRVISPEKIFFWDDLHPESNLCRDGSGNCFRQTIAQKFAPRFPFSLSGKQFDQLKQLLFPSVRIVLPERKTGGDYQKRVSRLAGLDNLQEGLARKLDGGHRIITGPAGCGKTLVLVHKAAFLLKYNPQVKKILLVCYNITLANYIRRMLADRGVPLGDTGVQVMHYYELCGRILGERISYENEASDYYQTVTQLALDHLPEDFPRFDAVLVDEGQDFSADMLRLVVSLVNPKTDNVTVALDEEQALYQPRFAWKDAGLKARGRVHAISHRYRATCELSRFADAFIHQKERDGDNPQQELFPEFFDFHGPKPELKQLSDSATLLSYVADKAAEVTAADGCPCSEIAVLFAYKNPYPDLGRSIAEAVQDALAARGVLSTWVSRDFLSKKSYDITTNSAAVCTIHSAKGMDYANVFLLGLDAVEDKSWGWERICNLVHVGVTRARYRLFIPYVFRCGLITRLQACL